MLYVIRSARTGHYHCRDAEGELKFCPLSKGVAPVKLSLKLATAAKRLLERKFKMSLVIEKDPHGDDPPAID